MNRKFFYTDGKEQKGPALASQIFEFYNGNVGNIYVWCDEMTDWKLATEVEDFQMLVEQKLNQPVANNVVSYNETNSHQNSTNYSTSNSNQSNMQKPNNYLVLSIITLVTCCMPLGIAALIYSMKVDSEWSAGRYESARENSEKAKKFALIGLIGGAVIIIVYMIIVFAGAFSGYF